jgi:F-type H+-transporting ATPase subunit delta
LNSTVAVEELAAIAANPQLRQLADNPNVSDAQVFDLITGVAKSALPESARNFLCGPRKRPSGRAA